MAYDPIKSKMIDYIKAIFEKRGIDSVDAIKGVIIFKAMCYAIWPLGVPICYRYRPLQRIYHQSKLIQSVAQKYPWISQKVIQTIEYGADKIATNRFFKPIPAKLGLDPKRFATSLGENFVLYKLTLPVTMPIFFFTTVAIISKEK